MVMLTNNLLLRGPGKCRKYYLNKYKNEVGCKDDSMQQSSATPEKQDVGSRVAEDCCILSTLPLPHMRRIDIAYSRS